MTNQSFFKGALCICIVSSCSFLASPARSQATVTLNGTNYSLRPHPRVWLDGPSGALTAAMSDTSNRAQSNNPAYAGLVAAVNTFKTGNYCSTGPNTYNGNACPGIGAAASANGYTLTNAINAAFLWFAQGANPSDPNGYLAIAKYGLDHAEDFASGSFACDESAQYCNRTGYDLFNEFLYEHLWTAYSMVRSQMSPAEISTFAAKILNDNDTSHNGLNATSCTKQTLTTGAGTISVSGNVVTGVGTSFKSTLAVGSVIFSPNGANAQPIGTVYSVTSDTQVILTTSAIAGASGATWRYAGAWTPGNCGLVWLLKHHNSCPAIVPGQESHASADYPLNGSYASTPYVGTDDNNITQICLKTDILMGLALADDDARARTLLTQSYNYFYNYMYPKLKMGWDGYNQGGGNYSRGTQDFSTSTIAIAVRNSVLSGPDLTPGYWLSRNVPYAYFEALPNQPTELCDSWGDGGACYSPQGMHNLRGAFEGCYITSGPTGALTSECQAFYNYLRNVRGDYSAAGWNEGIHNFTAWLYTFYNYNGTAAAPPTTQYIFKDNDLTYSQCASMFTASSPALWPTCVQNEFWGNAISKSDWTPTATQMLIKAGWDANGQDHTSNLQQGAFHIYRNVYLLAGDTSGADGFENTPGANLEDMIDLNNTYPKITYGHVAAYAPFSRWASTDPTGDASSRYAYAMVDLTNMYSAAGNATRVQRHVAHFKKSGGQDYIIEYDDIALSAPIAVAPKAYFHYFLNGVAPGTAIKFNAGSKTVSNTQSSSLLNSAFVATAGSTSAALVVDNANGTYTGGSGYTFRAYLCPSSNGSTCDATKTNAEWIGVFEPVNGTGGSMPALTQLPATNFRVVQVADSTSPKVAAFAQSGNTYSAVSFTTSHSGTGQYLIAGLAPGTYNVTLNGSALLSNQAVVSGDNTLYFESASGLITVSQTGAGVALSCDLNGDGLTNDRDVQISISAYLGIITCLPQYQLDQSGACTAIDVQRVVAASIGLGCKTGS